MASRRYRGKSTLNGNIGHVNARLNVVEKMAAPKRLQEGAITTNYLAENAVTSTAIAPGSVGSAAIAESSITSPLLATNAVTGTKILDGAITDGKINSSGISGNKITSGTVDANYIGNLPASKITSGTIDAARLPAVSSDWDDITGKPTSFPPESHTHAAGDITSGTFDTARIPSITGSMISSNTIEAGNINAGAVDTSELAALSVTTAKIADLAVTGAKIATNTITQSKIDANSVGASELIETENVTFASVDIDNGYYVDGVIRVGGLGNMYPVTTSVSATAVHQSGSGGILTRAASSRRYKVLEEPVDTGLGILNLQPKTWIDKHEYERNGNSPDGLNRTVGFIAEDLDDAGFGLFVYHNPDGTAESIDYGRLVAAVIPVLKHLNEEVIALKQALSDLGHEVP